MGPSLSINQPTNHPTRDVRCSCQASTSFSGEAEDNKAEEKASEQFLGRSMPLAPEKTSTPLTGAALSSNWVLFETIYDKFESLTGKKWSRDEVGETSRLLLCRRCSGGCDKGWSTGVNSRQILCPSSASLCLSLGAPLLRRLHAAARS